MPVQSLGHEPDCFNGARKSKQSPMTAMGYLTAVQLHNTLHRQFSRRRRCEESRPTSRAAPWLVVGLSVSLWRALCLAVSALSDVARQKRWAATDRKLLPSWTFAFVSDLSRASPLSGMPLSSPPREGLHRSQYILDPMDGFIFVSHHSPPKMPKW
ncbi:hypothetical protein Q1695_012418 [Nippostrongylus brasiliensis]|nr:hypothetical protein Q1695_012418 [Nippostrongylus brasiliensis]